MYHPPITHTNPENHLHTRMTSTLDVKMPLDSKPEINTANSFATSTGLQPEDLIAPGHAHITTRLSDIDLNIVCYSIGGTRTLEGHNIVHPTSWLSPSKGLPYGLYRDVVMARVSSQRAYYACSLFFNVSLILQLILGALLTALGSRATDHDTLITVLAASNTVNAGLLALMHNSGLPGRFKKDWDELDKVESFIRELMNTGIVRKDMTRDEAIVNCYANFRMAKETIARNQPSAYSSTDSGTASIKYL